jgi:hypothetical protein
MNLLRSPNPLEPSSEFYLLTIPKREHSCDETENKHQTQKNGS